MGATDINISFGANTAGIQQALSDIRQSVNQYSKNITSNFQTVNQTLNETRNKFATINNAIDQAKNKWTDWADKTATIRNSFRIAQVTAQQLSTPLREFSRFEDAATRLAPLVGGLEAAKSLCEELRDEAANGTMSFEQLASVAGRLSTVFKNPADVQKWTTIFHNISAGTGLDINELIGNFTKLKAAGRVTGEFPEREKLLASALVDGTKPYETVYLSKNELVIQTKIDTKEKENYIMTTLEDAIKKVVTSERGKELIGKIQKGTTDYNAYGCEFIETKYSTGMETTINDLGKIDTPPVAAPNWNSWLLSTINATKERGDRRWKISKTWKSADAGSEWDKELYGKHTRAT